MCSLSLEHTGLIIHPSLLPAVPFYFEFEPLTRVRLLGIGDLLPLRFNSFLFDGAGDLKVLLPFEIGVELKFG